jgi:hypothetical protein
MPNRKKYSVNWENGQAVSFEIDGKLYNSLDEITNPKDLRKMMAMMDAAEETDEFEEGLAKARPDVNAFPIEKVILRIFTGIAILMLLIAVISAGSSIMTMLKEKSAPGKVVDVVSKRQYINQEDRIIEEYYYPVVDFKAEDGRRRTVPLSEGTNFPEYEKGDEVTILYNPDHPLDARIKSFGSTAAHWILPGITGILGLAFLGAVYIVNILVGTETPAKPE